MIEELYVGQDFHLGHLVTNYGGGRSYLNSVCGNLNQALFQGLAFRFQILTLDFLLMKLVINLEQVILSIQWLEIAEAIFSLTLLMRLEAELRLCPMQASAQAKM